MVSEYKRQQWHSWKHYSKPWLQMVLRLPKKPICCGDMSRQYIVRGCRHAMAHCGVIIFEPERIRKIQKKKLEKLGNEGNPRTQFFFLLGNIIKKFIRSLKSYTSCIAVSSKTAKFVRIHWPSEICLLKVVEITKQKPYIIRRE